MEILISILISFLIIGSVLQFISTKETKSVKTKQHTSISLDVFYTLIIIYCTVILGFGLIYFLLSLYDIILIDNVQAVANSVQTLLYRSIYFSGVTLLTIGYGDITPIGVGRTIAIIQALIGYLLPTAFVLKIVALNFQRTSKDN